MRSTIQAAAESGWIVQPESDLPGIQIAQATDQPEPAAEVRRGLIADGPAFDGEAGVALEQAGITPDAIVQQAIAQGLIPPDANLDDPEVVATLRELIAEVTGVLLEPAAPEAPPPAAPAVTLGGGANFAPNDPGELPPGIAINDLLPPTGLEFGLITGDVLPEDLLESDLEDDGEAGEPSGGPDGPNGPIVCDDNFETRLGYDPSTPVSERSATWSDVTLTGIASDGTVLENGVLFGLNGVGVRAGRGPVDPDDPADFFMVRNQINRDPETGESQALRVEFDEPICQATVTVSRLIFGEAGTNEVGLVEVWNGGELVAEVLFGGREGDPADPTLLRLENAEDPGEGQFTIDAEVLETFGDGSRVFDTLVFKGAPYEGGATLPDDSSDYFVRTIDVVPAQPATSTLALNVGDDAGGSSAPSLSLLAASSSDGSGANSGPAAASDVGPPADVRVLADEDPTNTQAGVF